MGPRTLTIQDLWQAADFTPNRAQKAAICHASGPLYLPAGPGSGKTRVLLWRALNLIVFHDVPPDDIYLSTFTEKAALQLKEGLQALLGHASNITHKPYDLTRMYVGTVHSLCQRILTDRRFSTARERARPPRLLDELGQYFRLYRARNWDDLTQAAGINEDASSVINTFFSPDHSSASRHSAVSSTIDLFNRLSEECIEPAQAQAVLANADLHLLQYLSTHGIDPTGLGLLLSLYAAYKQSLRLDRGLSLTDFSLLQQDASRALSAFEAAGHVFQHVIVDEYQDTNTIQERLFFQLASGHKNLCVVGDDDQALYRFRGATVENFVTFPDRCLANLGLQPTVIPLGKNYRSRKRIVDFYGRFMDCCDWSAPAGLYRVPKLISPVRKDPRPSVIASTPGHPDDVCHEIAALVRRLIDEGKVQDPNQIAFLFPSVKYRGEMNVQVRRMKEALEDPEIGLKVYAPRAGRFLDVDEPLAMFGVFVHIFEPSPGSGRWGGDYAKFYRWIARAKERTADLMDRDAQLDRFVRDRKAELAALVSDYRSLYRVLERQRWALSDPYDPGRNKRALHDAAGLSDRAKWLLLSTHFERFAQRRLEAGNPIPLQYVLNRAASLDWNVLDLFYRICGFSHFANMFTLAEAGSDEGPICNLGLITQYLARFIDEYVNIISADLLLEERFQHIFFGSYLYALYRLAESEYEDAEDPFPKGRIPFLTIHQSKGLEFPVVVLANPRKRNRGPQQVEKIVRPLLQRDPGEPLDRLAEFDIMRMFYVALSRPKNLQVIAHFQGSGQSIHPGIKALLDDHFPRIPDLDLNTLPPVTLTHERLPKPYSYTADFLKYKQCPREYMIFRKYGFESSRSQTMFFGTLVHRTLEDLHNHLISSRTQP